MIEGIEESLQPIMPKYIDPTEVINTRAARLWKRFGERWEARRNCDLGLLINASPNLQAIALAKGARQAFYDAKKDLLCGMREDDPEKKSSQKRVVLDGLRPRTEKLYWQVYGPRQALWATALYHLGSPQLSRLTDGISDLPFQKQRLLEQLIKAEKYGIVGYQNLRSQLQEPVPLNLLTYSCLPTVAGEEEISPVLGESKFFRMWPGRLEKFFDRIYQAKALDQLTLTILMVDTEPWDVWGWSENNRPVNEKTIEQLIENGRQLLTQYRNRTGLRFKIVRYSSFFSKLPEIRRLLESQITIPPGVLEAEIALYQSLGISLPNLEETARKSILTYAAEGVELQEKLEVTIIGVENPVETRQVLYSLGRQTNPQPVIQPIKL